MENTVRRTILAPELAVGALVGAAALPLARIFRPGGAGVSAAFAGLAVCLALSRILRLVRLPLPVSALVSLSGLTWFASASLFPATLVGPFPSAGSLETLARALSEGLRAARVDVAPVEPKPAFRLLVTIAVWIAAWLAHDAVARLRRPLLAAALPLPLLVFPGTIVMVARTDLIPFLAAALLVLFRDESVRLVRWGTPGGGGRPGWRPGPAVGIGATCLALSLAIAPGAEAIIRAGSRTGARAVRVAYNPLVSIRPSLTRIPVRELFRVTTTDPTYLRLTALDTFDGRVWTAKPERASITLPAQSREATRRARMVTQRIAIAALSGPWLPTPYDPVAIRGAESAGVVPSTRALVLPKDLSPGLAYEVDALVPNPTLGDLDLPFRFDRASLARYLDLPVSLPAPVRRIAEEVTDGARTPFRRVLALQNYLRSFTYDENVAAGHSFSDILEFLTEAKRGYCEQFAGSMAVLARAIGIPARVAVGFVPGNRAGPDTYLVTTKHAHAWVEIFFPSVGWVAFEPTPRRGYTSLPAYAAPAVRPTATARPATPATAATPRPSSTSGLGSPGRERSQVSGRAGTSRTMAILLTALAGPLLIAAVPSARALRRSRRRRRVRTLREQVLAPYREFVEWCARAGFARRREETPLEHAARLATISTRAADPAHRLASVASAALWAPTATPPDSAEEGLDPTEAALVAAQARRALLDGMAIPRRVLAGIGVTRRR